MKGNLKKSITRPKYEIVEVGITEITADVSMLAKSSALYFNATLIAKCFDKGMCSHDRKQQLQRLFDTEARAAVGAGEYDGLGAKHATSI